MKFIQRVQLKKYFNKKEEQHSFLESLGEKCTTNQGALLGSQYYTSLMKVKIKDWKFENIRYLRNVYDMVYYMKETIPLFVMKRSQFVEYEINTL